MEKLNTEEKSRLKKTAVKTAALIAAGLSYYLFVRITGIGIPCIIKLITGKYCPGCGISRMFMAIFEGDIRAAAGYNLLVMILILPAAILGIHDLIMYIKHGSYQTGMPKQIFFIIVFIMTIAFWIMRNTEKYAWLAP